jgi:hypothetical protein
MSRILPRAGETRPARLRVSPVTRPGERTPAGTDPGPARCRHLHGPTSALWHAVELHRPTAEVDGACELTLCGSLARVDVEQPWPTPARDVCPACVVLTS